MRNASSLRATYLALLLGLCASAASAQEKPFARTFLAGSVESYQVQVLLRIEVHGVATQTIGEKTYVKPSTGAVEATLNWTSTRRILSISPDGAAQMEETDTPLAAQCSPRDAAQMDADAQKLWRSLEEICSRLSDRQTLRYEERPDGLIRDLPAGESLALGETGPPLLALWLRRSLRPSLIFPSLPFHPGARGQRPVLTPSGMQGSETTEWIDGGSSAAMLHVVQELSWPEPALKTGFSSVGGQPAGKTTFFADSSATISLLDGAVISSTRTASRETKRILDPVAGLPHPPEFSSKITIVVAIRRIS